MKLKKLRYLRTGALIAVGVFLGRGAHADTTITFDCTPVAKYGVLADCIPPQVNNPNNPPGITNYGNFADASSPGIAVSGFGTPNIGLGWGSDNWPTTRWEYYNTSGVLWGDAAGGSGCVQLQGSFVGVTETLTFAPNNPSASATIESFKFFPYYNDNERFTYDVSVVSGTHVLSGPTRITYLSDGTKNHVVTINYTGTPGQTLKLKLARVASTLAAGEIEGNAYNIAVDDIAFAQTPATTFPAGPQVISVTPADGTAGLPATASPAYTAIITNGPTLGFATPVQLKLDGTPVSPPPTVTPLGGGLTQVSYPGAASSLTSGEHLYTLVYADTGGGFYTNYDSFNVTYATLPAVYALPPGSGVLPGFTFRLVSASQQATNLDSTIARAIAQLNGTLTNPATGLPFTNDATLGTNADGSYSFDTVINFDGDGFPEGDFPGDQPFPGLFAPPNLWFSTEALLFLDLPAGYYRLGVNSDDGFEVNALPRAGVAGPPITLGIFDGGRGAADTLFDVVVTNSGVYPFQVIYFQSGGFSTEEFFSVTNLATGDKVLVNDLTDPSAILAYREVRPIITHIAKTGSNLLLTWAYGAPPYQLQFKNKLTDATWNNLGSPTTSQTATVPISPGTGFFRVYSQ